MILPGTDFAIPESGFCEELICSEFLPRFGLQHNPFFHPIGSRRGHEHRITVHASRSVPTESSGRRLSGPAADPSAVQPRASIDSPTPCWRWASKRETRWRPCFPTSLEQLEVYWACAKIGAVVVPLEHSASGKSHRVPAPGLRFGHADANSSFVETIDSIKPELPAIAHDRYLLTDGSRKGYPGLPRAQGCRQRPRTGVRGRMKTILLTSCTAAAPPGCPKGSSTPTRPSGLRHLLCSGLPHDAGEHQPARRRHRLQLALLWTSCRRCLRAAPTCCSLSSIPVPTCEPSRGRRLPT